MDLNLQPRIKDTRKCFGGISFSFSLKKKSRFKCDKRPIRQAIWTMASNNECKNSPLNTIFMIKSDVQPLTSDIVGIEKAMWLSMQIKLNCLGKYYVFDGTTGKIIFAFTSSSVNISCKLSINSDHEYFWVKSIKKSCFVNATFDSSATQLIRPEAEFN